MFGLSWGQIGIIVLVGVFVLGPERIPTAVRFVSDGMTKARTLLSGAQSSLHSEIGPELDELRRQIAELQELKGLVNLKELKDLHPQRLLGKSLMGDSAAGGLGAWLTTAPPAAATTTDRIDLTKQSPATPPAPTLDSGLAAAGAPNGGAEHTGAVPAAHSSAPANPGV